MSIKRCPPKFIWTIDKGYSFFPINSKLDEVIVTVEIDKWVGGHYMLINIYSTKEEAKNKVTEITLYDRDYIQYVNDFSMLYNSGINPNRSDCALITDIILTATNLKQIVNDMK